MSPQKKMHRLWLGLGGALVAVLAAAVFTLGSLNPPVAPQSGNQRVVLFALTTLIVAALLVFALVLTRSLLRLGAERRAGQLGSHFKTKMAVGALALSLLPVIFMFLFSYGLMNRTLSKWFPRPLEIATRESQNLLNDLAQAEHQRLVKLAESASANMERGRTLDQVFAATAPGVDAMWLVAAGGRIEAVVPAASGAPLPPRPVMNFPGGVELWAFNDVFYFGGRAAHGTSSLVAAKRVPDGFLSRYNAIESEMRAYLQQGAELRNYRTATLAALLLFTVVLLFSSMWVALFLSKQVTVPIQALVEATREISQGNFDHRVTVRAQDELASLVSSFNQMTAQLGESRRQIDEFTRHLQHALEEIERRRTLLTTLLENIPTGVLLLDGEGAILQANPAVERIFGSRAHGANTLAELLGEPMSRDLLRLIRQSVRMGAASRELEVGIAGRLLHAAVTVSALGPRTVNSGYVVVIDDLTELLRAQKAAAWQEVAQRIAHEIKNPLTPIQLSAQRMARAMDRAASAPGEKPAAGAEEIAKMVAECSGLIEREVTTLKSLVDEFSQFARFPAARLAVADLNEIVSSALEIFNGRLDGIGLRTDLSDGRLAVRADAELLCRVFANLIDNAAEAMENSALKELRISTRLQSGGEAVEAIVADTGHGISPADKDKLFLPQFSTRDRGTGLGLAIASRIIAEHHGTIRVEDNQPFGARFVIRLPAAEAAEAG